MSNDAWTIDPAGVVWFASTAGLFKLEPGGAPVNVDADRMGNTFQQIDRSVTLVDLEYDADRGGVWIFLTPMDPAYAEDVIHLFYDCRLDAFWKIHWPNIFGPTAPWCSTGMRPRTASS